MNLLNLLGAPFGGRASVPLIDPHLLGNRVFEIDAIDNSGMYSAVSPALVPATAGELVMAWQDIGESSLRSPLQMTSGNRGIARQYAFGWGLEVDGIDNWYEIQTGIGPSVFSSCTIYTVLSLDSIGSCTVFSSNTTNAFQDRYSNPNVLRNSIEDLGTATNPPPLGTRFVDCITYTGSLFSFYRNGQPNGTIAISRSFTQTCNRLFVTASGSEWFDGILHQRIVFNAVHNSSTIASVMAFLKNKWQVA